MIRFSSRASASGSAYTTGELLRQNVVHRSLLNVIFFSFQSIVGLCSRKPWHPEDDLMVLKVCHLEGCQFPMVANVHRYFRLMGNGSHSAWFSVRQVNLPWILCFDHLDHVFFSDFPVDKVFCCS